MIFFYVLLSVYILAVNFYAFWLVKSQREEFEAEDGRAPRGDSKLVLAALFGGATAIYCAMFAYRYRLSNLLLMVAMPVLAVFNCYSFFLGYRGIALFL